MKKLSYPQEQANPTLSRAALTGLPTEDEQLLQRQEVGPSTVTDFTRTDPWRVMRIMGEFVSGFDALAHVGPAVAVFGSARASTKSTHYQLAHKISYILGREGFSIITGGGPGIMEAANRGAKEAHVHSVGCNIELPFEQHFNPYVTLPINFRYFFVRKTMFMKYAEGFVIFPGGFGTLDELFEALTLIQTGKVRHFPIILVGKKYWSGLIAWIKKTMLAGGNISANDLDYLKVTDSIEDVKNLILDCFHHQDWQGTKPSISQNNYVDELADAPPPLIKKVQSRSKAKDKLPVRSLNGS